MKAWIVTALSFFAISAQALNLAEEIRGYPLRNKSEVDANIYQEILPGRFRYAEGAKAQPLVDYISVRIFDSATARASLCFLGTHGPRDLSNFLGISRNAALEIQRKCEGVSVSAERKKILGAMRNRFLDGPTNQLPKSYALLVTPDSLPAAEGFTAQNGLTTVFLNEREATEAHLIRVFAHELAMSFDGFGTLAPEHLTTTWQLGLTAAFETGGSFFDPVFHEVADPKDLHCALRDTAVRMGMAAERAYRFEDRVIADLGLQRQSPAVSATSGSCARIIAVRARQASVVASLLKTEMKDSQASRECKVLDRRATTLAYPINRIQSTQVRFIRTGKIVNLCDLLIEPRVGPRAPEKSRHAGPRPRTGPWGGDG